MLLIISTDFVLSDFHESVLISNNKGGRMVVLTF